MRAGCLHNIEKEQERMLTKRNEGFQDALHLGGEKSRNVLPSAALDLAGVPQETLHIAIFRLACKLRRAGVPSETAALLVIEAATASAPSFLVEQVVEQIVRAYGDYPN